jgi:predicted protein tyrosine phosphatase
MNVLFVCNQGENRSRTGAELLAEQGQDTRYAGIYSDTMPVTRELLAWADKIIVFEQNHVDHIKAHWPELAWEKPIFNLEIPDRYCYGSTEMRRLIGKRMRERFE